MNLAMGFCVLLSSSARHDAAIDGKSASPERGVATS
jgi:hypothetical protein